MKYVSLVDELLELDKYLVANPAISLAIVCYYKQIRIELKESASFRIKKHWSMSPALQQTLQTYFTEYNKGSTYSAVYKQMYELIKLSRKELQEVIDKLVRHLLIESFLESL